MPEKTIQQKLAIKPGHRVVIINPPAGYLESIGPLPQDARFVDLHSGQANILQVFVKTMAEVLKDVEDWKAHLKPGGILWITYPKGTSRVATDLNRDILWKKLQDYGLEAVAIFAVDTTWSAMRLKQV